VDAAGAAGAARARPADRRAPPPSPRPSAPSTRQAAAEQGPQQPAGGPRARAPAQPQPRRGAGGAPRGVPAPGEGGGWVGGLGAAGRMQGRQARAGSRPSGWGPHAMPSPPPWARPGGSAGGCRRQPPLPLPATPHTLVQPPTHPPLPSRHPSLSAPARRCCGRTTSWAPTARSATSPTCRRGGFSGALARERRGSRPRGLQRGPAVAAPGLMQRRPRRPPCTCLLTPLCPSPPKNSPPPGHALFQ
jgi:hypothetical protein